MPLSILERLGLSVILLTCFVMKSPAEIRGAGLRELKELGREALILMAIERIEEQDSTGSFRRESFNRIKVLHYEVEERSLGSYSAYCVGKLFDTARSTAHESLAVHQSWEEEQAKIEEIA